MHRGPTQYLQSVVVLAISFCAPSLPAAAEDCRSYKAGPSTTVTIYCPGDQKCAGNDMCTLSAGQQKHFDRLNARLKVLRDRLSAEEKVFKTAAHRAARRDQTQYRPGSGHCPDSYPFHCRCEPAGGGAAWAAVCRPKALSTATPRRMYRQSIITPQRLYHRAAQGCQGTRWDMHRSCIVMGKIKILMDLSPMIQKACSGMSDDALVRCVDDEYFAPVPTSGKELRDYLHGLISALPMTIDVRDQLPPDE